jgi:hypothetical protein
VDLSLYNLPGPAAKQLKHLSLRQFVGNAVELSTAVRKL